MLIINELEKINELIRQPCNMVWKIPFVVNCYEDVLKEWKNYKLTGKLNTSVNELKLKNIFEFHKINMDHIILYWSLNQPMCLLMCKINNKYINLTTPMLLDNDNSFIATYT